MQAALRIEDVRQAEQVVLVGTPAVMEDEQARGVIPRRSLAVDEGAHVGRAIGASLSTEVGCRQVSALKVTRRASTTADAPR
jgi:hypothetical protein